MKTSKALLYTAFACLLFFALGHSLGHLSRHQINDHGAQQVLHAMQSYQFNQFGVMRTYDENYTGMSLNLIMTLITLAVLIWFCAKNIEAYTQFIRQILAIVMCCCLVFAITSLLYFFMVPAITCLLASACIAVAIVRAQSA